MGKVIRPPIEWHISDEGKLVYLAGGIEDGVWQDKAIELLHAANPDLVIANPATLTITVGEELKQLVGTNDKVFIRASWETAHIRVASQTGGILFWISWELGGNPKALFELGEWITHMKYRKTNMPDKPIKLVVGVEPNYHISKYLVQRILTDCPDYTIADSIENACKMMTEALKEPTQ